MVLLSQDARDGDPTAIGLNLQLSSYKYVALLHFTADVLNSINHLSRIFQHNDVSFSSIRGQLQDCLSTLEGLHVDNGPYMTSFVNNISPNNEFKGVVLNDVARRGEAEQHQQFQEWREQLLRTLTDNVRNRFPRTELLDAMKIFEPAAYPTENHLVGWGNCELEVLINHYGTEKTVGDQIFNPLVDADRARAEFLPFKRLISRNKMADQQKFYRPTELMTVLFSDENKDLYPEMFKMMSLSLCVLVGNADAERIFSCQNRIKTRLRSRLTVDHLDQLIRLSFGDNNLPFDQALDHFMQRNRRL